MRNSFVFALVILCTLLLLFSCNKDEASLGNEQTPVQSMIENLTLFDTYVDEYFNYEFGCFLRFEKPGKITKLRMMVPDDGTYLVTVWELPLKVVVNTTIFDADSGKLAIKDITDIEVLESDEFAVTLNGRDFYGWNDGGASIYPVKYGDVEIFGYAWLDGVPISPEFPNQNETDIYGGYCDVVFEPMDN